jgi:hypothetical protein
MAMGLSGAKRSGDARGSYPMILGGGYGSLGAGRGRRLF